MTAIVRFFLTACAVAGLTANPIAPSTSDQTPAPAKPVRVLVETEVGSFEVEVDQARAPMTAANFLRYVDGGFYDGGRFHRSVRLDNQVRKDVLIQVVQGGIDAARRKDGFPAIPLERTSVTGIRHGDGAISMARDAPDTATSDFFICVGDQPELDFAGKRNRDGQGFAAFGAVVAGMDVVRKIHQSPTGNKGESLAPPIRIIQARRRS